MKYFCNNNLIFPVILNNYFLIFPKTFLKYFCDIPAKDRAIHCRNVTEEHFMKYLLNITCNITGIIMKILSQYFM